MKVFLAWSGDAGKAVATSLHDWLKKVMHVLEPFMSEEDITTGDRWSREIAYQLEETRVGILCLTPDNLRAPWLHFEAGALSKMKSGIVMPYLFGGLTPGVVPGPLSQFQAKLADHEGTRRLVRDLRSEAAKESAPGTLSETQLDETFEMFWPKLEEKLREIPRSASTTVRPPDEMFQEITQRLQRIERQLPVVFGSQIWTDLPGGSQTMLREWLPMTPSQADQRRQFRDGNLRVDPIPGRQHDPRWWLWAPEGSFYVIPADEPYTKPPGER
jgi:hypothetical protein